MADHDVVENDVFCPALYMGTADNIFLVVSDVANVEKKNLIKWLERVKQQKIDIFNEYPNQIDKIISSVKKDYKVKANYVFNGKYDSRNTDIVNTRTLLTWWGGDRKKCELISYYAPKLELLREFIDDE